MKNLYKEDLERAIILLEESLYFINSIPKKDKMKSFKDSYELASEIDKFLDGQYKETTEEL